MITQALNQIAKMLIWEEHEVSAKINKDISGK